MGRFITADPLPGNPFQPQATNRYAYALNNPIAYQDTSGLSPRVVGSFTHEELLNIGNALSIVALLLTLLAAAAPFLGLAFLPLTLYLLIEAYNLAVAAEFFLDLARSTNPGDTVLVAHEVETFPRYLLYRESYTPGTTMAAVIWSPLANLIVGGIVMSHAIPFP